MMRVCLCIVVDVVVGRSSSTNRCLCSLSDHSPSTLNIEKLVGCVSHSRAEHVRERIFFIRKNLHKYERIIRCLCLARSVDSPLVSSNTNYNICLLRRIEFVCIAFRAKSANLVNGYVLWPGEELCLLRSMFDLGAFDGTICTGNAFTKFRISFLRTQVSCCMHDCEVNG